MSIWNVAGVEEHPEAELVRWGIMQLPDGSLHFTGHCPEYREGRVSSRVEQFDHQTLRGVTRSGRVYQLLGEPRYDSNASYVWNAWAHLNGVTESKDISKEIYESHTQRQTHEDPVS